MAQQTPQYDLAPLLYWFAEADGIPAAWQARFGPAAGFWRRLSGLGRGDGEVWRRGQPGPGRGTGTLAAPGRAEHYEPGALRYEPTRQEWAEIEPGVWCGVSDAAKPADFLRARLALPLAYVLKTARGDWLVPVALLRSERCALPRVDQFRLGEWRRVPAPGYADLSECAESLFLVETGEAPAPDHAAMREIAVMALAVNYALTAPEMGMLGLLTDDTYAAVAAILTDRDAREKKEPAPGG